MAAVFLVLIAFVGALIGIGSYVLGLVTIGNAFLIYLVICVAGLAIVALYSNDRE